MNQPQTLLEPKRSSMRSKCLRSEELHAAVRFEELLWCEGHSRVEWSQGDDPPDLDFIVDHERWAVEVTYVDQQLLVAGRGLPRPVQSRQDWSRKSHALCEEIRRAVQNDLQRRYVLTLPSCPPDQSWPKWKRELIRQVVSHVRRGGGNLSLDLIGCAGLADFGPGASFGCTLMAPLDGPDGQLSTDVAAAERSAFADALDRKDPKLAKLFGYDRVVLFLINKYWYYEQFGDHARAARVVRDMIYRFPRISSIYFQIRDDIRRIA